MSLFGLKLCSIDITPLYLVYSRDLAIRLDNARQSSWWRHSDSNQTSPGSRHLYKIVSLGWYPSNFRIHVAKKYLGLLTVCWTLLDRK